MIEEAERRATKRFRLVVGDPDETSLDGLCRYLLPKCVIAIGRDSEQVLDAVCEIRPHVVLIDDGLPGRLGVADVIERVRTEYRSSAFVLCARPPTEEARKHWEAAGAVRTFHHPTKSQPELHDLWQEIALTAIRSEQHP
jgi:DNA-binding response OmpR family regulator